MIPGPWQILLIVVLILLLFGAGRLPRIMGDIAKGIKSFKKGMKDEDNGEDNNNAPKQISNADSDADDIESENISDKDSHKNGR